MSAQNNWVRIWRLLRHRKEMDDELDAELRSYFEMVMDRHLATGLSREEAWRAAQLECEGVEQVKERVREVRVGSTLESVLQDVRYGWRGLVSRPAFTLIAVSTLALGMGVNAAIFSVFYAALLRPLPYDRPGQLGLIWSTFEKSSAERAPTSGPLLEEIKRRNHLFQDVAGIWVGNGTFAGENEPEQVKLAQVTTNFLQLLGVKPLLGRGFSADEKAGGRPVVVLSYGLWKRHFGGDQQIVGKAIPFQGVDATVVGVIRRTFSCTLHRTPTFRKTCRPTCRSTVLTSGH